MANGQSFRDGKHLGRYPKLLYGCNKQMKLSQHDRTCYTAEEVSVTMDIYGGIVEIVALVFRLDSEQVRRMSADDPLSTIGLDSLNCMEIVVNVEEEFGVAFHDEELLLDNLNTINKLCAMVSKKLELYTT